MDGGHYEVRVRGRLDETTLEAFDDVEIVVVLVETVLRCSITDQAALHGLLDRIQALGLDLMEVRRVIAAARDGAVARRPPGGGWRAARDVW